MQNDELRRLEDKVKLRRLNDKIDYLARQVWRLEMAWHTLLWAKYHPMAHKDNTAFAMCMKISRSQCRLVGIKLKNEESFDAVEVLRELGMNQLFSQPVMM